jgi:hypothetical protein
MLNTHPSIEVAVVMQRMANTGSSSYWQPWRWQLADVVQNEAEFGDKPRLLYQNESGQRWLHGGLRVELFTDEAEGYYLNGSTDEPCWFVLWRMEEEPSVAEEPIAKPVIVTLSYNEAGRWLDAQETVEQVRAPAEVLQWLNAFTAEHYVVEPKRRKRPESFRSLSDRFGNPASISTEKKFGSPQGGAHG